jgi:hypothetical protein
MYGGEYDINDQSTHNPVYDTGDMYDEQSVVADSAVLEEHPRLDSSRGAVRKASLFSNSALRFKGDRKSIGNANTQSDDKVVSPLKPQIPVIDAKKPLFNPIRFKAGGDANDKTEAHATPPQPPKQLLKKKIFNPTRFKSAEDSTKPDNDEKEDLNEESGTVDDIAPSPPANDNRPALAKPKPIEPLKTMSPKAPPQAPIAPVSPAAPKRPTQFKALVPQGSKNLFKPKAATGEVVAAQEGQFPVRIKQVAEIPVPPVKARRTTQMLNEPIKDTDFNL